MNPPSTKRVIFWTKDGVKHKGFFLKDANKYVRNVNRWKDEYVGKWFDNAEVTCWERIKEQEHE